MPEETDEERKEDDGVRGVLPVVGRLFDEDDCDAGAAIGKLAPIEEAVDMPPPIAVLVGVLEVVDAGTAMGKLAADEPTLAVDETPPAPPPIVELLEFVEAGTAVGKLAPAEEAFDMPPPMPMLVGVLEVVETGTAMGKDAFDCDDVDDREEVEDDGIPGNGGIVPPTVGGVTAPRAEDEKDENAEEDEDDGEEGTEEFEENDDKVGGFEDTVTIEEADEPPPGGSMGSSMHRS